MRGIDGVKDNFELKSEHRGVDKIFGLSLANGNEIVFEGAGLADLSVADGSLGLKASKKGKLTIWTNRDWDKRLAPTVAFAGSRA